MKQYLVHWLSLDCQPNLSFVMGLQIQLKSLAEEMQAVSKGLEKVEQEIAMSENDGPPSAGFRTVCLILTQFFLLAPLEYNHDSKS